MLTADFFPANLGPSAEWVAAYKAETAPRSGTMSIAPKPEFAWACEQILGGYTPGVVITAIRYAPGAFLRVRELHAEVMRAKKQQEQH